MQAEPKREEKTETITETVPCPKETYNDPALTNGQTKLTQACVNGEKANTFKVVYIDGKETERTKTGEAITKAAVAERTAIGTKPPTPTCDPNYSGACVPIASDVDCAGGSGNGPVYVSRPVYVIGSDIYDLDRDGDGVGCE
ncbi:G5 domain-containing protein [Candidatus Microgenomates bacterium]|nr:G5 domain-containing protein [Candidatus Microgenomates bacterium]